MPTVYKSITARAVADLTNGDPNAPANSFVRDPGLAGFAIRVGRSKSAYIVESRSGKGGRVCRFTLGTVGKLDLDEARTQAKERLGELARGADPVATLRAQRGADVTLRQGLALLAKRPHVKPSTVADYLRSLEPLGWLDKRLASIKPSDVLAEYDKRAATPTSAGRIFRSFRACWNAARDENPTLPECPTSALKNTRRKWATAPRKRRVLADSDLPAWRKQVAALERDDVRDLILFMHYSGCRIGETKALTLADVDLPAGRFTLADPKNGRPVDLPATKQVRAILARRLAAVGDEPSAPLFPQGDVRKSHASVDAADWSYHDLRRGFVTHAHRLGVDDEIARALTNHSGGDAHSGYVSMTADTLRPEAQRIADHLDKLAKARRVR